MTRMHPLGDVQNCATQCVKLESLDLLINTLHEMHKGKNLVE